MSVSVVQRSQQRLYLFDLLRLFAIVEMIFGHTVTSMVVPHQLVAFPWTLWQEFRGFTAPLFLMVSGVVQVYANKRDAHGKVLPAILWRRFRWAVALILIGYLLVLPARSLHHLPYVSASVWQSFWKVNILQLIGVALILNTLIFAATASVRQYRRWAFIAGSAIVGVTPIMAILPVHQWLPMPIAQYCSFAYGSFFPVFPYAAYMLLGGWFGAWLWSVPQHHHPQYYRRMVVPLFAICAVAGIATFHSSITWLTPWLGSHPNSWSLFLFRFTSVLGLVAVSGWLLPQKLRWYPQASRLSSKAFFQYIFHLILLYGTAWWDGPARRFPHSLSLEQGVAMAAGIIALCFATSWGITYVQHRSLSLYRLARSSIAAIVVLLLLLP